MQKREEMRDTELEKLIRDFCDNHLDYDFYEDYSGRFMYGRTCVGILTYDTANTVMELTEYLLDNGVGNVSERLGKCCVDSMGQRKIVYFPHMDR